MAEDRFANVFAGEVTLSAANILSFAELNFGITLRDRIAVVIDELYFWALLADIGAMTAVNDQITWALTVSDQVSDILDMGDRRILASRTITRMDFGTAASAQIISMPLKESYAPPLIVLPNRLFFAGVTVGLSTTAVLRMRMHFRTVSITQDQQLIEVLESFQLST